MAGIASKIAKTVAGTAAAAGIYYAGKQSGMQEAAELQASNAKNAFDGDAFGNEAGPKKSAYPVPPDTPEAFHAALNDRANSLRDRIYEKAFAEGTIEERFDRIVGNAYMMVEQAEIPAEADAELQEEAETGETAEEKPAPEEAADPEADEPAEAPVASDAQPDGGAQGASAQQDAIDLKNAKTGDLDPYHRIQKALSTSEFFAEEDEGNHKPPEFEMP